MNPKVSIITLNWNGWEETLLQAKAFTEKHFATIECLESLYHITYPNYNVIVVDNASEKKIKNTEDKSKGCIETWIK